MSCKSGYILNPASGRCVKKDGPTGKKLMSGGKKMTCPRGQIERAGYERKAYTKADGTRIKATYVSATCIEDKGNKGKGPKLIPKLKKGELSEYGYHIKERLAGERRKALKKALKEYDATSVNRKLNALATLNKNTHPTWSERAKADAKWVKKEYL